MYHSGRSKTFGTLEDVVVLTHSHREKGNIAQRVASKVYLTGLAVAHLHAIVDDSGMLRAKSAHIHRLHATDATIVAYLQTSKMLQCLAHVERGQP